MMKRWRLPSRKMPPPIKGAARFAARRRALSRAFPGEALVVPTGHEKIRSNDATYSFRPGSDFYYLTGNQEPDCALVLLPKSGGGHEDVLYVEPNPGRTDPTFFTDRAKGELWVGPRMGVEESRRRYQIDRCEPIAALAEVLAQLRKAERPFRMLRGLAADLDVALPKQDKSDKEFATFIAEQRLTKDAMELAAIKRGCDATRRAYEDIIRALKHAQTEREIEGTFDLRARVEGNGVGYTTIVASGPHACILHWTRNDGRLRKGELVLIDAGVESHEIYTADVTRTLPINGRFSSAQREIYDLVLEAQSAAMSEVKPGAAFLAPHRAAMRVLAEGLVRLRILTTPLEEALEDSRQFYKRYTLHNTSHMLGLDVHDCAHAREESYRQGVLKPGMVFTVEPGLYFQPDDLTVPAKYRGIGVRIEDDVVVTTRGHQILTDLPRASVDVERWMKQVWSRSS